MSYLGRYQIGQTVTCLLQSRDGNQAIALPARPPQAKVFLGATVVEFREMPILDRFVQTGFFQLHLFLGTAYALGKYQVVYYYQVGAWYGLEADDFEIVGGGDPDGAILGMYWYQRPQADYSVYSTETGTIQRGRNPAIR